MSNEEEQAFELEALASIYPTELTVTDNGPPAIFEIEVKSEAYDLAPEDGLCVLLKCTFTSDYPTSSIPDIAILPVSDRLNEADIDALQDAIVAEANEQIGMAMIFTLVSSLQERLNAKVDELRRRRTEEEERVFREEEEANRKKLEGTPVTVETFLAWKTEFDKEMSIARAKKIADITASNKRPTGKEQFLKDATLNLSDIKLIEDADENMKIDESLFEDLDDLDLEDED